MAKRNDFMEGFLRGLYQSGVGNPDVNRQNAQLQQEQAQKKAEMDASMAEKGMIPDTGTPPASTSPAQNLSSQYAGTPAMGDATASTPSPTSPQNPPSSPQAMPQTGMSQTTSTPTQTEPGQAFHPDHPIAKKIGSFIANMAYPGSNFGSTLAQKYKPDPNATVYAMGPDGKMGMYPRNQIPQGNKVLSDQKNAATIFGEQYRQGQKPTGDMSFDQAKNVATVMGKPGVFDSFIAQAQKEGRDTLSKSEIDMAMKGIGSEAWSQRGEFFKQQAQLNREKFDFAKRQATYGGKMGQGQMALNTAIGHLGDAMDSMVNLGNTDVSALNRPINEIGRKMDNGDIVAAGINLTALNSELASAYKGGGATDQEIREFEKGLSTDLTPNQWLAAATKTSELLNSKIGAFGYQQGLMNPDVAGKNPLSPTAQKTITKIQGMKGKVSSQLTPEDQQAIDWANKNPLDPRAVKIKRLHGIQS